MIFQILRIKPDGSSPKRCSYTGLSCPLFAYILSTHQGHSPCAYLTILLPTADPKCLTIKVHSHPDLDFEEYLISAKASRSHHCIMHPCSPSGAKTDGVVAKKMLLVGHGGDDEGILEDDASEAVRDEDDGKTGVLHTRY